MNSRAQASIILKKIIDNKLSLDHLLPEITHDRAFIQTLCYGVLRFYPRLSFIASLLLEKPLKKNDHDILMVILIGLYQLLYLDTETFAAVNECVEACKQLKKKWAAGMTNAVLRRFLREKNDLLEKADKNITANFSHPDWLIKKIKADWPSYAEKILLGNNEKPPMTLRVNRQQYSRENYLSLLKEFKIESSVCEFSQDGIILKQACNVTELPNFLEGACSIQDEAAQLAASLLAPTPNQTVLDACAAPGGKTCHLLEYEPTLQLTSLDINEERLEKISENLDRLHLHSTILQGDAKDPDAWWDKKMFDRILVDAPCSATGVIRRHPEIKLFRTYEEIKSLAKIQLDLLKALWPLLKKNGILLYATCSIFPDENTNIVKKFLSMHQEAEVIPIDADWGIATECGRQLLPNPTDGFFYAKIKKLN